MAMEKKNKKTKKGEDYNKIVKQSANGRQD